MQHAALSAVLDTLAEGVLLLEPDGAIVGLNQAARRILDVSDDFSPEGGCACLMGEDACAQSAHIRQSIADRAPVRDVGVPVVTGAGNTKVLSVSTNIMQNADGSPAGGVIVFRDVTELTQLRRDLGTRYRLHNIIGKSKPMQDVFELIEQVADTDATVLIEGETGTGKELVARAIHHLSGRSSGPFVAVNCSALPETLLESELFGHVKGAFTGAMRDKRGRFEAAEGGTIFLDEIGDVSPAIQIKLLRVLQERTIERVGDERPINVDIRVMSATNRPLLNLVKLGTFRIDLFYRLRVIPINLPALRARRDDIPLLARHFIDRFSASTGRRIEGLSPAALAVLFDHDWPGNVRELENVIEYAFVKARAGHIEPEHLPPEVRNAQASPEAPQTTDDARVPWVGGDGVELDETTRALNEAGWNISKAARRLGISRTTLYKRIRAKGLSEPT